MSTRLQRTLLSRPERPGKDTLTADPPDGSRRDDSSRLAGAGNALNECVGAISLIEVTVNSLDAQEIASPEQEVLKRALQALWSVHDWMYDRKWPDTPAECDADRECQS